MTIRDDRLSRRAGAGLLFMICTAMRKSLQSIAYKLYVVNFTMATDKH